MVPRAKAQQIKYDGICNMLGQQLYAQKQKMGLIIRSSSFKVSKQNQIVTLSNLRQQLFRAALTATHWPNQKHR